MPDDPAVNPAVDPAASSAVDPAVRGEAATARPPALRVACLIVGLEALGLLVGGLVLLVDSVFGHPGDRVSAILAGGFALLGAVALAAGARGLLRARPAARTPVIVLEILAVPVGYQLWFDSERPEWGGPIFFAALAVLYLLFTPPVRALLNREEPGRRQ
jgi:hypothetical protein